MTHYVADVRKARDVLDWTPKTPLEDGIPQGGRLVQRVARRASGGGPAVRAPAGGRTSSNTASSSRHAPARSVLALFGPTASGKTAVAGLLRERLGATVVSADSAALYAGLPVITAAPAYPARARRRRPARRGRLGRRVPAARARGDRRAPSLPLVVGGTGLYFRAALSALELPPPPAPGRREHWQHEVDRLGPEAAHALLAERDPAAAARVHANDRKRLVRALELAEAGASLAPRDGPPLDGGHAAARR